MHSKSNGLDRNSFHPDLTYPIYGEAESIYGYTDLHIRLCFSSGALLPLLRVTYKAKNEQTTAKVDDAEALIKAFLPADQLFQDEASFERAVGEESSGAFTPLGEKTTAKVDDAEALIKAFLPADQLFQDEASFERAVGEESSGAFTPLGEKVHEYTRALQSGTASKGKGKGRGSARGSTSALQARGAASSSSDAGGNSERVFEIYRSDWSTPGWKEQHRRMQIFTLLFIEGASYIQEEEPAWQFYTLYERQASSLSATGYTWHFVGYTSLYNFWCYPDSSRVRLSQFIILPPYQHAGHGQALYNKVLDDVIASPRVMELTVEDPSEAFDRVRDGADLRRLFDGDEAFAKRAAREGRLVPPLDQIWSEKMRSTLKIAPRQWSRLVEMAQLLNLDQEDHEQMRHYRLQVKSRLYKFNKDVLQQMSRGERVAKLHQTYEGVIEEYSSLTGVEVDDLLDDYALDEKDIREAELAGEAAAKEIAAAANGSANANGPARKMARLG
ncbi:histone acetyltransferase type b catalytic subunit [Ceraceosorus bombacis]|uniref:Histone acetyltransferase type B catalytic subunit n=1 Tax=Ceraceosorus bombacis TaxID=401625 RepID=A0A0P1BBM0_9BASI|nr:histone acetyltransferase type b catalytic subunit [Ceraceosorus bombacis]